MSRIWVHDNVDAPYDDEEIVNLSSPDNTHESAPKNDDDDMKYLTPIGDTQAALAPVISSLLGVPYKSVKDGNGGGRTSSMRLMDVLACLPLSRRDGSRCRSLDSARKSFRRRTTSMNLMDVTSSDPGKFESDVTKSREFRRKRSPTALPDISRKLEDDFGCPGSGSGNSNYKTGSGSSRGSDSEESTDSSPMKVPRKDLGLSPPRLFHALTASIERQRLFFLASMSPPRNIFTNFPSPRLQQSPPTLGVQDQNAQDEDEDRGPFETEVLSDNKGYKSNEEVPVSAPGRRFKETLREPRPPRINQYSHGKSRSGEVDTAFRIVFSVGNNRLQRMRLEDKHPAALNTVVRQPSAQAFILLEWLDSFFLSHCERQPNDGKYHLPNNFTKKEVYDHYKTDMTEAIEALQLHRKQQAEERAAAGRRRWKALDTPKDCAYIQIDGMDQKKTALPHFSKQPKYVDGAALVGVHLVGAMVFHGKMQTRAFLTYNNIKSYSNLTITVLHKILLEWEGPLPPTLYLQLDNIVRENKNNILFAYLAMLLDRNIFSKIKLGFLLVGHTHDFVDQMFSRFSQALRRENAFTMSRLRSVIQNSYDPKLITSVILQTWDFKNFIETEPKLFRTLNDITHNQQYKFKLASTLDVRVWCKQFSTDQTWEPPAGVKNYVNADGARLMLASQQLPLKSYAEIKRQTKRAQNTRTLETAQEGDAVRHVQAIRQDIQAHCYPFFEDVEKDWWNHWFFQQEIIGRNIGRSIRERLTGDMCWLWHVPPERDAEEEVELLAVTTAEDLRRRVFGIRRPIYSGPRYRRKFAAEGRVTSGTLRAFGSVVLR
ncbi:hypothetical protein R1sor_008522 [Riccia sorocarpa]|uniref:DUF7869 domain-containing protein n=1 Tax=Riccia sorocarpa TaxID=122646 RepID=A0ABD3HXU1_9MARC